MDRRELCHQWAAQSRPRRKAGNISFDGPTLYSYSTAIAHIHARTCRTRLDESGLDAGARERFVLMTVRQYSKTTACQKSAARGAVSHLPLAEVPHIQPRSALEHRENVDALLAEMQACADKAARRTYESRVQSDAERAAQFHKLAADYLIFFGIRRKMPPMPGFAAAFERARRIENPDPASADKRERARAQRAAAKLERERRQREAQQLHIACARTDWRLGGAFGGADTRYTNYLPRDYTNYLPRDAQTPVMLRVEDDELVTSMGARVPLAAAPMVWAMVQRARRSENGLAPCRIGLSKGPMIGDYPLDRIDADGTLHAGCHTIPFSELAMTARTLGLGG